MRKTIMLHKWLEDFMTKHSPNEWPPANVIYELLTEAIVKDIQDGGNVEIVDLRPEGLTERDLN